MFKSGRSRLCIYLQSWERDFRRLGITPLIGCPPWYYVSPLLNYLFFFKFDLIETFGLKYVTRFLRSLIATLHSLIQDNRILLDTPKNVPIFFTMQKESKSSQPFVPVQFNGVPLNELDAKQKSSDGIISWWSHFLKYWNTYLDLDSNSQTFGFQLRV